jgi:hypothetical protein
MFADPAKPRIDRIFGDIPDDQLEDLLDAYEARMFGFGWSELLRSKRILIVSEAGVGKTHECRAEQERLWADGEAAFFVELSELARKGLDQALILGSPEHERFQAWMSNDAEIATFFLDSLDELKLQQQDFGRALRALSAGVKNRLERVRIVITTRPTSIDVAAVRAHLPVPSDEPEATADAFADLAMGRAKPTNDDKPAPDWRHVRLLPLSDEQIRAFAANEGVINVDAFMQDIDERNTEEFARRPQDLIELCAGWNADKRIRLHADQVSNAIFVKLKASEERPDLTFISDAEAREGASRLALAALLGRKFRFRLPGKISGSDLSGALDTAQLLPDWTPDKREALLQRPLFGYASYHEVRFQHRSVIEYLAAERLLSYYDRQLSRRAVRRLLFATTAQGTRVVRPTMRATAAWMALKDAEIFRALLDCEPSVLLMEGDPQSLSLTQRTDAMRAFVGRFRNGGMRAIRVPWTQVRRIADPQMAPVIHELWPDVENPEIRAFLLNVIEAGKIGECMDIAFDACRDRARHHHERLDALDALVAVGDDRFQDVIHDAVDDPDRWPLEFLLGAIARHFPLPLGARELDLLLIRIDQDDNDDDDDDKDEYDENDKLHWLADKIRVGDLALPELDKLLEVLLKHVRRKLRWVDEAAGPACGHPQLLPALLSTCEAIWAKRGPSPEIIEAASIGSRLLSESNRELGNIPVRLLLASLDASGRALAISTHDNLVMSLAKKPISADARHIDILSYGSFDLSVESDLDWVIAAAIDGARSESERELYVVIGMWLAYRTDIYESIISRLKVASEHSTTLLAAIQKETRSTAPDPELARMRAEQLQRQEERAKKTDEAHGTWVELWKLLAESSKTEPADKVAQDAIFDVWRVMSKADRRDRSAGWNRHYLERNFGVETTARLKDAIIKAWRVRSPTLRSERSTDQKNTTDLRWRLGLAGLSAEAEDPHWAGKLTPEEASIAARHVPVALNAFPNWLEALIVAHPQEVDDVLGAELTLDLAEQDPKLIHAMQLQNLSYSSESVKAAFRPRLLHWLQGLKSPDFELSQIVERLHRVSSILLEGGETGQTIVQAFVYKHLDDTSTQSAIRALLPIELRFDPDAGIGRLERLASGREPAQLSFVVELLGSFLGDRFGRQAFTLSLEALSVDHLMRLLRLTYTHVRQAEDLRHRHAYSPGLRDNAQDARRDLLNALLAAQGTEAWLAKVELARDPLFEDVQDYIRAAALKASANEADKEVLAEAEIYAIQTTHEAPPTNRDDMFALMNDRIDDLEDFLVHDTSQRRIWATIADERDMRSAIGNELEHRANCAYQIDQESITSGEKETDIRFRSLIPNEEGVIELKVGDKEWSVADYRNALEIQLVSQYLAPEHRRAGCLLITFAGGRDHWINPDSGQKLAFEELVALLQVDAAKLVELMSGTIRLAVRGLDLREDNPTLASRSTVRKS